MDSILKLNENEIRHFCGERCSEFFVTASKPGIYKLRCRLLCAEYTEPDYQDLYVEAVKVE